MQKINITWRQQKKLPALTAVKPDEKCAKDPLSRDSSNNKQEGKEKSLASDFSCSFPGTIGPDVLQFIDSVEQQINADKGISDVSHSPGCKRMYNGEPIPKVITHKDLSLPSTSTSETAKPKNMLTAKCQLRKLKNRRKSKQLSSVVSSANGNKHIELENNKATSSSVLTNIPEDELCEPRKKLFRTSHNENPEDDRDSCNSTDDDTNSTESSVWGDSCDRHLLSNWGLPKSVLRQYAEVGVSSMFPWQVECLALGNVLRGGNLVYAAPTSAGKTLVAEILVLKRILETRKKAIIILPYVSVAREKMFYLKRLLRDAGIRVDGYMGSHHPPGGWKGIDIAVCTIERANGLINRLMEEKKINQLGVLVVDELHMLGDSGRGYLLELLLTKVRYLSWKFSNEENFAPAQIIGMSATLPNLDLLANWLQADLYKTDFRPVPLSEHIKIGNAMYDANFKVVRHLENCPELATSDSDHVIQLCLETITAGHAVLIFCPTKAWCETLAKTISKEICRFGQMAGDPLVDQETDYAARNGKRLREIFNADSLEDVLSQLKRIPSGLDRVLFEAIRFGVAFHHAGLTFDERDIIEAAFRNGTLKVLVATTTLSSGVNLPARRVIIRSPVFLRQLIDVLSYRQMIGRAGRKGIDTEGESVLICKENERSRAMSLVQSELRPIQSCLIHRFKDSLSNSMKRAVLEVVVSGVASCPEEVEHYCDCTLLAASLKEASKENGTANGHANAVKACINFLVQNEFIVRHTMVASDGSEKIKYVPTPLGNAVMASSISPDEGLIIFSELCAARREFVLESELHIVYQVTPLHVADQWPDLDWQNYYNMWSALPADQQRVAKLVGVDEQFLVRLARMQRTAMTSGQYKTLAKHQRFYTAMALHDLVNEIPLNTVAQKYGCNRGMLQSLQQSASTFAGMVTAFCNRLGWHNVELLLAQFQKRLNFGIQRELCDLVRLPLLNGQRARILYNGDIRDVSDLARSSVIYVETLLRNAGPFASEKKLEDESAHEFQERRQARCIWLTGNKGLTEAEAAKVLIDSARELLQKDLGISIHWENESSEELTEQVTVQREKDNRCSQNENAAVLNDSQLDSVERTQVTVMPGSQDQIVFDYHNIGAEMKPADIVDHNIGNTLVDCNEYQDTSKGVVIHKELSGSCSPRTSLLNEKNNNGNSELRSQASLINENIQQTNLTAVKDCHKFEVKNVDGTSFFNEFTEDIQTVNQDTKSNFDAVNVASASILENFSQDELFMNISNIDTLTENKNKTPTLPSNPLLKPITPVNFSESFILDSQTTNLIDGRLAASSKSARQSVDTMGSPANCSSELFDGLLVSPAASTNIISVTSTPFPQSVLHKSEAAVSPRFEDSQMGVYMAGYTSQVENEKLMELTVAPVAVVNNEPSSQEKLLLPASQSYKQMEVNHVEPTIIPEKLKVDSNLEKNFEEILFGDNSSPAMWPDTDDDNMGSLQLEDTSDDSMLGAEKLGKLDCLVQEEKKKFGVGENQAFTKLHDFKSASSSYFCDLHTEKIVTHLTNKPKVNHSETVADMKNRPTIANEGCRKEADMSKLVYNGYRSVESKILGLNVSHSVMNVLNNLIDDDSCVTAKPPPKRKHDVETNCIPQPKLSSHQLQVTGTACIAAPLTMLNSRKSPSSNQKLTNDRRSTEFVPPTPTADASVHSKSLTLRQIRNAFLVSRPSRSFVNCRLDKKLNCSTLKNFTEPIVDSDSSFKSTDNELDESRISDYDSDVCPVHSASSSGNSSHNEPNGKSKLNSNLSYDTASFLSSLDQSFQINDVVADKKIFLTFVEEWKAQSKFSLCLACVQTCTSSLIGHKIKKVQCDDKSKQAKGFNVEDRILTIVGLAVSWEAKDAYYISLNDDAICNSDNKNDSFSPLTPDKTLSIGERLDAVKSVVCRQSSKDLPTIVAYDFKEQMRTLYNGCGIFCYCPGEDPKVGYWLIEPTEPTDKTEQIYSLKHLVSLFSPQNKILIEGLGGRLPVKSLGFSVNHPSSPRLRAAVEAVLILNVMKGLEEALKEQHLISIFKNVEMKTVQVLLKNELTGIGISATECKSQLAFLQERLKALQDQAFQLAGHSFSLNSQASVAQVLYVELALPPGGEVVSSKSSFSAKRRFAVGGKKHLSKVTKRHSTNKKALEKLQHVHPLPGIILEWRRLSSSQYKMLMPLAKEMHFAPCLKMQRIYGTYIYFTATGRMSMREPNLQSVPRDYEVNCTANSAAKIQTMNNKVAPTSSVSPRITFRVREAFIPCTGFKLLSADYSQLELRLLAHLCQDVALIRILNGGGDVFKNIAAKWKGITVELVTSQQRQQAKQICYGMVYGIGERALSEQLGVEEEEAAKFMRTFKSSYPGIKAYIQKVVEHCQRDGYVTTLMGRRRYLPHICNQNLALRSKSERQAVNTTIQGSAADLIKRAMVAIDDAFNDTSLLLERTGTKDGSRIQGSSDVYCCGARLVLQLHDELLYEVQEALVPRVVQIIRKEMEGALHLSVSLPVNIKTGSSWADLNAYEL